MSINTIAATLAAAAATPRGVRAIEHDGRSVEMPYAWLFDESLRIAGDLLSRGLTPGDRVAVIVPEVNEFIRVLFGIAAAGLVPIPLAPPVQAGDLETFARQSRQLLAASRARAVVASADVAPLLQFVGDASGGGVTTAAEVLTIDEFTCGAPLVAPVSVDAHTPALIQFTSGSTAIPKGVVLSQSGLRANLVAITAGLAVTPDDVGVNWLPLYHDMGLVGTLLAGVFATVNTVIMSPVLFLKRPTAWLDAISRYRGSISFAPNFAYELCLRRVKPSQIDALDLASWRVAGCGAEPIRYDTLNAFAERFACAGFRAASFVPSYGLAEHCLAVAFAVDGIRIDTVDSTRLVRDSKAVVVPPPVEASAQVVRVVSCGRPFPDHEVRIIDDQGQVQPDRHLGHIVARGPSVMAGYFENPEATAEALHDGWLQTGDLGYCADGELFVCGRTKDLIIRHGRKYHPPDLELAIAGVPGMRGAGVVVFGVTQVEDVDRVVAVVEARASSTNATLAETVRRRVRETAGLEIDEVLLTPPGTIPRTTSGKVRRSETRARFEAGTLITSARHAGSKAIDETIPSGGLA